MPSGPHVLREDPPLLTFSSGERAAMPEGTPEALAAYSLGEWRKVTGGARGLVLAAQKAVLPIEREIAKIKAELEGLTSNPRAKHEKAALHKKLDALKMQSLELARDAIKIPESERGGKRVRLPKNKNGSLNWDWSLGLLPLEGAAIVENYTHPDLLPTITEVIVRPPGEKRAGHFEGKIYLSPTTPIWVVAHEITHATEQQTQEILEAAKAFRESRRINNEAPKWLSALTGKTVYNERLEMAYEDSWRENGGHPYSGKVRQNNEEMTHATEILTTGIERLHKDPLLFARHDPEFFSFVVNTLRKW